MRDVFVSMKLTQNKDRGKESTSLDTKLNL